MPLSGDQRRTTYFALAEYRDRLLDDLATAYHGNEKYCTEDDVFLATTLAEVCTMMYELEDSGVDAQAGRAHYRKTEQGPDYHLNRLRNAKKRGLRSAGEWPS